jgi:hypothetical protein
MNAVAAAAIMSFWFRLFLFNAILSSPYLSPPLPLKATQRRKTRSNGYRRYDAGNL